MAYAKGETGNPGGKPKDAKQFRDALNLAVKRADGDKTNLARIAEALVTKAMSGDVPAINCLADRLDGKPQQEVGVTHDGAITLQSATISLLDALIAGTAGEHAGPAPADTLPN